MKRQLIALAVMVTVLASIVVGMSTSSAQGAQLRAMPAKASAAETGCTTRVHWTHIFGQQGSMTDWLTCAHGYKFRARAECFPNSGKGKPEWRSGGWKNKNQQRSTAGCTSGYYLDNGGYNAWGIPNKYFVLWRYSGVPL